MYKKIFLISSICTVILIIGLTFIIMDKKEEKINNNDTNVEIKKASSFLTLMLQQDDGTYQKSTSNTWPNEDYAFNEKLSQCENGGELYWDTENLIVKLITNKSDKCYIYFDKSFIYPKIIDYAKSVTLFKGDKLYFNEDTLSYVSSYPIEKIEISINGVYYYRPYPDSFTVNLNPGSYGLSLYFCDNNNQCEGASYSITVV